MSCLLTEMAHGVARTAAPFCHQAAGHEQTPQGTPSLLISEDGLLLKNAQDSIRGTRELQFYACLELCHGSTSEWCQEVCKQVQEQMDVAQHDLTSVFRCSSTLHQAIAELHGIKWFCPRCCMSRCGATTSPQLINSSDASQSAAGGPGSIRGTTTIRLQNLCDGYEHPNVVDIKIGRTAVYEWATDEYKRKKRAKEAGSWQQAHAFKICGMRVWDDGAVNVLDKKACTTRSQNMPELLTSFAAGRIDAVWKPVQDAICKILDWAKSSSSPSWHLYSASLLVVYDGMAQQGQDKRVQCSLIDFSHTFFAAGRDSNFVEGLQSLWALLRTLADEQRT